MFHMYRGGFTLDPTPRDALASPAVMVLHGDPATRAFLIDNLVADGYEVLAASGLLDGARLLAGPEPPVAVIVDLGAAVPELAGRLADARRQRGVVLVGLARDLATAGTGGLFLDVVVSVPFSYPELRARLALALRGAQAAA